VRAGLLLEEGLTSLSVSSAKWTTADVAPFFNMAVALSINASVAGVLDFFATAKTEQRPKWKRGTGTHCVGN